MDNIDRHIIYEDESVRAALSKLNKLGYDSILFVVDKGNKLIGSLTDGDLRRGFISDLSFEDSLLKFIQKSPISITEGKYTLEELEDYKNRNFKIIPILNDQGVIIDVLNFRIQQTIIQADAVIMAGGEGKRLRPLTETVPKPLLKVGSKPIIDHNIDRLISVGIRNIHVSVNYLADQIIHHYTHGEAKGANIMFVKEDKPLGTIGSILLVDNFRHEDIIVMNSDLLTNIDFADFFKAFKESSADLAVAATSYNVDVPYAVMEVDPDNTVLSLKEKPRYTYYSNAGIYLIKKEILKMIPDGEHFDITDLMDEMLIQGKKLITYPITGYWLDIGKHEDFKKAQEDIKHIKLY